MVKALTTKNVVTVLAALALTIGISFASFAPAKADTVSDLQAQVQALLAQIQALQGSSTTTTTTSSSAGCYSFTQNLRMGASGGQVMWVQQFLNNHGFTVATTGAGSPGNETSYFGPATERAVIAFQNAYASSILTPEGLSTGNGNWYAATRAEANSICTSSTTTTTTGTGGTTTSNGAGITITSGTQPANSLAPGNANRVPFTTFTLTNNSGAAVTINGIDVQRTGLAANAAFAGVELVDQNGLQIGTSRSFNSNNQAEIGTPWTLAAGASMTYTVAGNMQTPAIEQTYAGQVASIAVTGVDTSVPVNGSLPITGASQTINSSLTIGTATAQRSSYDPLNPRSEPLGTTGLIFSGVRITAGSAEPEKLYSITWNQTGSVGSSDLANLVTVVNGTSYPVTVDSTGKYFTATFAGGILIPEGGSVDAYIQGDLVGSDASGRSVEFDIYRQTDIYLVGQTYGYGITATPGTPSATVPSATNNSEFYVPNYPTSTTPGQPFFEGAQVGVTAGTLSTVGNASSVGSQNIAINVPNQPLGGFSTDFTGEAVQVQSLTVNVASTSGADALTNVSIVDQNGNTVAGPVNETYVGSGNNTGELVFNSSVTFPVGAMTYTIKGTVGSNATNGSTYQLSTDPGTQWTSAQGQTSGANVTLPPTTITMSTMTVQAGQLAVSAASTPASTNVAPGANNFVIANINLDASQSGENIRLSSLPIVIDATSTYDASVLKSDLTNCQLYNGTTALNTQAVGSGQWNAAAVLTNHTINGFTSTAGLEANFTFQNAITIPKGTVTTLALECNVSSSLYSGIAFAAGVDAAYDNTTNLIPTGATSGNQITAPLVTASTNSVSGTMTVGSASLAATNPSPLSYALVAGGTTGVTVGTFTLQPTSDSVNLQNIGLSLNSSKANTADISRAYIYDGATLVGTVNFTGAPIAGYYYATSSISSLNVPQNQQTIFTIKADISQIGPSSAGTDGHEILMNLADAQGVGASSGTTVNSGPLSSSAQSGVSIFRTTPSVALSSYLPSNGVSDGRLIAFTITAGSNGPVGIDQLVFNIASSTGVTITAPTLYAYTDSGFSQPAGGTNGGIASVATFTNPAYATTTIATAPLEIPAGSTWYFLLKANVFPGSSSNGTYNISTTLKGDTVNLAPTMYTTAGVISSASDQFIWSPNATTTALTSTNDWTNGYSVSGLSSIGLTENRTN